MFANKHKRDATYLQKQKETTEFCSLNQMQVVVYLKYKPVPLPHAPKPVLFFSYMITKTQLESIRK
jgi:hypothetical protein